MPVEAKKSRCASEAKAAERARLQRLTPIERMNLALKAGRMAKYFAEQGRQGRRAGAGAA